MVIFLDGQALASDALYTIVTIFFTLSLIAERLSNILKLAWPATRNRRNDKNSEKCRELKVIITAICFGWIVAFLAGADLFTLLRGGGLDSIFAKKATGLAPEKQSSATQYCIGIFLSGVFISLGSKFWHDMFDIVLQIASLKKFRVDKEASEAATAELKELDARIRLVDPELRKIQGYAGYDLVSDNRKVNLKFEKDQTPDKAQLDIIQSLLGSENFQINKTNLKP